MNKRIRKKVAKRTGGSVQPHHNAAPQRKLQATPRGPRRAASATDRTRMPERDVRPTDVARALVEGVVENVQERAAGAVEHIKERLADTEQRAEQLLSKVPGVGPAAARKLHELTQR